MREECHLCVNKTVEKLINKFDVDEKGVDLFKVGSAEIINNEYDNPYLATQIYRLARHVFNNDNLYEEEKVSANQLLLNSYNYYEKLVETDNDPFRKAAILAVAGNVIDYGAHSVPDNIEKQISKLLYKELAIDDSFELQQEIQKAGSVLYLGDNAGEIVFDKLFIETMKHPNVTYVVRDKPVINDVTFDDIEQTQLNKVCKVISNGYDAPSTLLEYCSSEFLHAYSTADLIISKGQGNFEGLMNSNNPKIFFLLMAKCNTMAEMLGVKKGEMVVKHLKQKINGF
jgi:uncharacterized protein with ATP-grasp and redox domains